MKNKQIYRQLTVGDFDQAMALQYSCYPKESCESYDAGMSALLAYPKGCIGCFYGDELIGYSQFYPWKGEHIFNEKIVIPTDPEFLYGADIAVLSKYRGIGVGKQLMKLMIEHSNEIGLEIRGYALQNAETLWKKMGFEIGEPIDFGGLKGYLVKRKCD